jgi:hypothetical protein
VGDFNIVRDYDWTTIPRGSGYRNRAPRVYLKSYKVKSSEFLNRIRSYANVVVKQDADEFYDKLYSEIADPEDIFRIPFFGDSVRSFSNEYGDTFQSAFLGGVDSVLMGGSKLLGEVNTYKPIDNITKMAENSVSAANSIMNAKSAGEMASAIKGIGNGVSTAPGSYIETPKLYQYSQNDSGLEVSFILDNTLNSDNDKNTKLVEHLTRINRPKRINSVVMEPPRIYEVKLAGIRYIRWASCSSFSLQLLGAKRMIDGKIVPEGYLVSMSFTSLTTEVSNFMDKIN